MNPLEHRSAFSIEFVRSLLAQYPKLNCFLKLVLVFPIPTVLIWFDDQVQLLVEEVKSDRGPFKRCLQIDVPVVQNVVRLVPHHKRSAVAIGLNQE